MLWPKSVRRIWLAVLRWINKPKSQSSLAHWILSFCQSHRLLSVSHRNFPELGPYLPFPRCVWAPSNVGTAPDLQAKQQDPNARSRGIPGTHPGLWAQDLIWLAGWDLISVFKRVLLRAVLPGTCLGNFENKIPIKHFCAFLMSQGPVPLLQCSLL